MVVTGGNCKIVSITVLRGHTGERVDDDGDGTYVETLDGRAGRSCGLGGTGVLLGEDGVIRLQRRLHDEGSRSTPRRDHEGAGQLVLVLLEDTVRGGVSMVGDVEWRKRLWCDRRVSTAASPRSLPRPCAYPRNQRNMLGLFMEMV